METEIKFRLTDVREFERKLRALGFAEQTARTNEMNVLYDFPDLRLRSRGELLRLRRYGPKWVVTHKAKGAAGRHKSRVETETEVSDGTAVAHIFECLGLQPMFRYEKFRSEWSDGKGHVVLDETPIGNFAEIEGDADWIDETARKLGGAPEQYITQSYGELFEQWKRRTGSAADEMTFAAVAAR
jgi:adenylate cyclase class 2